MKISIILLAHNEEKNISDEIESIKKNILDKLENCELIVAEDGSVDRTKKIILERIATDKANQKAADKLKGKDNLKDL